MYKLLIADDNNMHVQCVLDYVDWNNMGFTDIRTASNGREALEIFQDFRPDLVITDVVMPLKSGVELARDIRRIDEKVHIIFMSCYEEFDYVKNAIDNDITAYILKPLEPELLRTTADKVILDIKKRSKAEASEQTLSEFLPLVRESLMYRLLYSKDFDLSEELIENANFIRLKNAIVIKYVLLDDSVDCNTIYRVLGTVGECFEGFSPNAIAEIPNKLIILLVTDTLDEETFLSEVIDAVKYHISDLKETLGLKISAGFSNVYTNLKQAHQMLTQATLALEGTYNLKANEIYFYEDFEENEWEMPEYNVLNLKEDLSSLLNRADTEAIEDFLKKYYPRNINFNKNTIKALCFSTVTTLQLLFSERNTDMSDLFENSDVIWQKLNRFETIQDTYNWLKNILTASCEFISNAEKSDRNNIVESIKDYIDKNFKDITSLNQIASELYISAGYARNVFKKYTGQTIFDYLVDTRIKEAKKLLKDPKYKIYEIRDLVGYTSKAHFIETFKRKTGMTPTEYRQNSL